MVESVPTAVPLGVFSVTVAAERTISLGVSLTFVTVTVNDFSVKRPPASVARMRSV